MFTAPDFLAEVSAHITDAHEKTTLFSGWDSHRTWGYRKRHGLLGDAHPIASPPERAAPASLAARRSWARLIRQVYEGDPLVCARCGGPMKLIAVIDQTAGVRQILDHLGRSSRPAGLRAPPELPVRGTPAGPGDDRPADPSREWGYEPVVDDVPVSDPVLG